MSGETPRDREVPVTTQQRRIRIFLVTHVLAVLVIYGLALAAGGGLADAALPPAVELARASVPAATTRAPKPAPPVDLHAVEPAPSLDGAARPWSYGSDGSVRLLVP